MSTVTNMHQLMRFIMQRLLVVPFPGQIVSEFFLGNGDKITGTIYSVNSDSQVLAAYCEQEQDILRSNTARLVELGDSFISRQRVVDTLVTILWEITKMYHVVIFNDKTTLDSGRDRGIPAGAIGWISASKISGEFEVRIVHPDITQNCVTYMDGGEDFMPNPSHFILLTLSEKFCLEDFMMHYPALTGAQRWEAARLIKEAFRNVLPISIKGFDASIVGRFVRAGLARYKEGPRKKGVELLSFTALNSEEP